MLNSLYLFFFLIDDESSITSKQTSFSQTTFEPDGERFAERGSLPHEMGDKASGLEKNEGCYRSKPV